MSSAQPERKVAEAAVSDQQFKSEPELSTSDKEMETNNLQAESTLDNSDVLLDLGDLPPAQSDSSQDFVLDIEVDETAPVAFAGSGSGAAVPAFVEPQVSAAGFS